MEKESRLLKALDELVVPNKDGEASNSKPSDFSEKQIIMGIAVEYEHTEDPLIACAIAMDHLVEDPAYYDKLYDMEKGSMPDEVDDFGLPS